jgi:hypothetical protein
VNTVTTTTIRDAFVVAIHAITPTEESLRAIGWNYTPSPRVGGRAALQPGTRNFDLIFRNAVPTFEWVGGRGTAYKVDLAVATSYAGVEPETCDHLKAQDAVDLRMALRRLVSSASGLPGLCDVRPLGEAQERETEATHYVEHRFEVHYHQATAA